MGGREGILSECEALLKEIMVTKWTKQTLANVSDGKSKGNSRDEARCEIPPGIILDDPITKYNTKRTTFKDDVCLRRSELYVHSLLLVYYTYNLESLDLSFSIYKMGHNNNI